MSIYFKLKSIILLAVILIGCGSQQTEHPDEIVIENLSDRILITAPQAWNTFKYGKPVSLEILNNTDSPIIFDQDFGKKIYELEDNEFFEVENQISVINGQDRILYPNDAAGTVFRTGVIGKSGIIRVYILGRFMDTGDLIGNYIELRLSQ